MGERRGTKALELWCRRITDGYPGVNVQNMTTSWRDGLAFCAMIHHFRPDLMDFNSLDKDDVYGNNELAFRTAEQHLGIPALLDAEDMASCSVPDRLSILTYLSQFYQTFGGSSPSRLAMKRTTEVPDERLASVPDSPQPKVGARLGARKEPCVVCGLPVFLAEKLVISRTLYHRTCFRCARCNNQLTLGNYYETEDGQYCCETCPDEEAATAPAMHQEYNKTAMLGTPGCQRSLSDEEKTTQHSAKSEASLYTTAIAFSTPRSKALGIAEPTSQASQMRLNFMASHLLSEKSDKASTGSSPPFAQATGEPQHPDDNITESSDETDSVNSKASPPPTISPVSLFEFHVGSPLESREFIEICANESAQNKGTTKQDNEDVNNKLGNSIDNSFSVNQHNTATAPHDIDSSNVTFNENTKDLPAAIGDEVSESSQGLSLVQQRLRMFENNGTHAGGRDGACEQTNARRVIDKPNPIVHTSNNNVKVADGEEGKIGESRVNSTEPPQIVEAEAAKPREESDLQSEDRSEGIVVSYESPRPLELPEGKEITAAVILQKMMDNRESRLDTSAVDTTLSNMSGVDLSTTEDYPEDLNPFQSDSDGGNEESEVRKRADTSQETKVSTNPFGSSDEEDDIKEATPPQPVARRNTEDKIKQSRVELPTKRRIEAPQISFNPFWSDDEGQSSDEESRKRTSPKSTPVPKPRTMKPTPEPSPVPRKAHLDRGGVYASNTSISSFGSISTPGGTYRKKKPAPQPPTTKELFTNGHQEGTPTLATPESSTAKERSGPSPRMTPRVRKAKPAPPPPLGSSTPQSAPLVSSLTLGESPISEINEAHDERAMIWDVQKSNKDETNRNRQSLSIMSGSEESQTYSAFADKSAQGKWKRKKGPAPPRPTPHKRKIKVMSIKDVKLELDEIELQQQGLEKQGVRLEQLIRDKCESGSANEVTELSLTPDVEELMLELFSLVNEKNELFRRQAELMLLRRQQRLEEEHADIEYQIRCLMSQPEATKTDSDKQREELLIQRLVHIVEQRNEIVECLEMDRRREVEEDRSINTQMGLFAAKSKGDLTTTNDDETHRSSSSKKEKIKEKIKEKKSKKSHKKDADKDVDETEVKLKRHKRKWF